MTINKEALVSAIVGALNACACSENFYLPMVNSQMATFYDHHETCDPPSAKANPVSGKRIESRIN